MSRQPSQSSSFGTAIKFIAVVVIGLVLVSLLGIGAFYVRYLAPREGVAVTVPQVTPEPGGTLIIPLANYAFVPSDITIPVGTTIQFQNVDPEPHTVTFDNNEYPALGLESGDAQEILFDKEGVYRLHCEFHGSPGLRGMSATIRVMPASASIGVPTSVTIPTPTPRPTIVPLTASTASPNGFGFFQDTLGRNDSFNLTVSNLPSNPEGEYYAWLTSDEVVLNLGEILPDSSGNANLLYFSPGDENLLATYTGFLITIEAPGADPGQPSSNVVFGGVIAPSVLAPSRQLLVAGDAAPKHTGYAVGLVEQTEELLRHAREIDNAAQGGDLASMNRHIEHLSAILAGKGSPQYLDFQGDGFVSDPGDGFGVLNYAEAIIQQAQIAASAPDANEDQKMRAAQLEIVAINIRNLSNQLIVLRSAAYQAQIASERTVFTTKILQLSTQLLNGLDANGNGKIEPVAGEGGVYAAYFQSQYLAAMRALTSEALRATPTAESPTPTFEVKPPPPTPLPASATGPAPTPGPAIVVMRNFAFVPDTLIVKAGTTVVFVIQDSRHEPYQSFPDSNDVSGFDSGLLSPGEQFTLTFNDPGTFTIRCRKHLKSMVMTLVVEP